MTPKTLAATVRSSTIAARPSLAVAPWAGLYVALTVAIAVAGVALTGSVVPALTSGLVAGVLFFGLAILPFAVAPVVAGRTVRRLYALTRRGPAQTREVTAHSPRP